YALWMEEKGLKNWKDYFEPWPKPEGKAERPWRGEDGQTWALPEEYHYSTWTGERSVAMLEEYAEQDQPFFLWASFHDPHPPYVVPEPWASMYDPDDMVAGHLVEGEHEKNPPHFQKTQEDKPDFSMYQEPGGNGCHGFHRQKTPDAVTRKRMATYYGMISFMDKEIGRILDALDRLGQAENTLVVFTTDHGHFLGQHGLVAKGAFHYEDMIRIPMIARYPGRIPAGITNSDIQAIVDLPPTFLAAAGIPVPGLMQGHDQILAWSGEAEAPRDHVIVENRHQPTKVHLRTYVDKRYKITVYRGQEYGELFDLEEDPGEVRNLWDDPQVADLKRDLLFRFMQAELEREPTRMPRIAGA
ncbi:sulfatase-like hydrolase/transferase, partial [bacterium]|nr:sulfatase-like hydrolase/transferase [bacterium]